MGSQEKVSVQKNIKPDVNIENNKPNATFE
jgi:hypothetical protein